MTNDSDSIRGEVEARRQELMSTVTELGDRFAVPRTTFIAGVVTGVLALAVLNRLQFRRPKR